MRVVIRSSRCNRGLRSIGFVVIDSSQGVGLIGEGAISADIGAHPDGRVRRHGSFDDDICALTDAQRHNIGRVRLNGHEVVCYYRHLMSINRETLNTLSASIDKSQAMRFAGLKLELGNACIWCTCTIVSDPVAAVDHVHETAA